MVQHLQEEVANLVCNKYFLLIGKIFNDSSVLKYLTLFCYGL